MKSQYIRILKYFGFILIVLLSFSYSSMQCEAVPNPDQLELIKSLFPSWLDNVMYDANTKKLNLRLSSFNFDINSAEVLQWKHDRLLKNIRQVANMFPAAAITVTGHTDSWGDHNFNQMLSEKRAGNVADYLKNNLGVLNILEAVGAGEEEPIASNLTPWGRMLNRRIEVTFKW